MAEIMILGSGGFGVSLSVMLHKYGHSITMWSKFPKEIDEIQLFGENRKLLPGIPIDSSIELTSSMENARKADLVIFAVPSFAIRSVAKELVGVIHPHTIVANVAKGFEPDSLLRLSEVIREELPQNDIVVLSGPSHAEEIARNVPTTIVAACENRRSAEYVQDILMNTNLRVYVNDDILGVELGGALKNIIAVCAGICDGLGVGDNTKAALMTRGLAEIARLGVAMGARAETFMGLSGMGDLIVTCTSMHSRNRRAGILIGKGYTMEEAMDEVKMVVEGVYSAKAAMTLAEKYEVQLPIIEQVNEVLFHGKAAAQAVNDLMLRDKKIEISDDTMWS